MWHLQGRAEILKVHSRDKKLAQDVDLRRIARATAGSTGADLMNLMNQSAILAVRAGRNAILESDILQVQSFGSSTDMIPLQFSIELSIPECRHSISAIACKRWSESQVWAALIHSVTKERHHIKYSDGMQQSREVQQSTWDRVMAAKSDPTSLVVQ